MVTTAIRVRQGNGERVELTTFLELVPSNSFRWSAFNLQGVIGVAPQDLWVEDFERLSKSSNFGYVFDWPNLVSFSKTLEDMYACFFVATGNERAFSRRSLDSANWADAKLVLELFDSSEWTVRIVDEASFSQLVAKCKNWSMDKLVDASPNGKKRKTGSDTIYSIATVGCGNA